MNKPLSGKTALVLGVETPPGVAAARALAQAGADVACVAGVTDGAIIFQIQKLGKELASMGVRAPVQGIDAGIGNAVQIAFRQVAKELDHLDIFVCATDATIDKPTTRLTDAEWAKLVAVNVSSVFAGIRAASRELTDGGTIVVLSPSTAVVGAAYAATRTAASALAERVADELKDRGISICVLPTESPSEASAAGDAIVAAVTADSGQAPQ